MEKTTPRYKKEPAREDMPAAPTMPDLRLCQVSDNKLVIPSDIRQSFLTCPVWGPEWREVLKRFDADWGVAIPNPSPSSSALVDPQPQPTGGSDDGFWGRFFEECPRTLEALRAKFGDDLNEMAGVDASTSFFMAPGPSLYIHAKDAVLLRVSDKPMVCHGAGSWLLGDKADKYINDHPGKAIPCKWSDDSVSVLIEDHGVFSNSFFVVGFMACSILPSPWRKMEWMAMCLRCDRHFNNMNPKGLWTIQWVDIWYPDHPLFNRGSQKTISK